MHPQIHVRFLFPILFSQQPLLRVVGCTYFACPAAFCPWTDITSVMETIVETTYKFAFKSAWNIQSSPSTWYQGYTIICLAILEFSYKTSPPKWNPPPMFRPHSLGHFLAICPRWGTGFGWKGVAFATIFFPSVAGLGFSGGGSGGRNPCRDFSLVQRGRWPWANWAIIQKKAAPVGKEKNHPSNKINHNIVKSRVQKNFRIKKRKDHRIHVWYIYPLHLL